MSLEQYVEEVRTSNEDYRRQLEIEGAIVRDTNVDRLGAPASQFRPELGEMLELAVERHSLAVGGSR